MKTTKRRKTVYIVLQCTFAAIFIAGASIAVFPFVNNIYYSQKDAAIIKDFQDEASELANDKKQVIYADLFQKLQEYNEDLVINGQNKIRDMLEYAAFPVNIEDYDLPENVIGYISIPKIEQELPLYLGANYDNMANGATVLGYSSAPIGGKNTNCVIAGHCGWNGTDKFRYLSNLKVGDEVIVTNIWDTLTYHVVETKIIYPNEFNEILIQQDKDMITLITCHSYASHWTYRYVVYCERAIN